MIKGVLALPIDPHKVSKTTILSIRPSGNRVLLDQRYDMKTTKSASDGSKRDVELVVVSTDTWIKSNDSWLLQRTVTNQMDYFVNGKQVLHKVRAA